MIFFGCHDPVAIDKPDKIADILEKVNDRKLFKGHMSEAPCDDVPDQSIDLGKTLLSAILDLDLLLIRQLRLKIWRIPELDHVIR